jgi:hypothetical protein
MADLLVALALIGPLNIALVPVILVIFWMCWDYMRKGGQP